MNDRPKGPNGFLTWEEKFKMLKQSVYDLESNKKHWLQVVQHAKELSEIPTEAPGNT